VITYSGFTWVQLLTLLVSLVLPLLVAVVTTRLASPGLKAVVLAFLAALTGFGSELLDALVNHTAYDVGAAVFAWTYSFILAVVAHFGALKPAGVTGSRGAVANALPGGIGWDDPGAHSVEALRRRLESEELARQ
jgi:hypothetical protein